MGKKRDKKADSKAAKPAPEITSEELERLQVELAHLQSWVVKTGARIVVVFEGRDAAGKGGMIKRITERVSPGCFAWWRCRRRPSARRPSSTCSATSSTCPPPARS